jgi:hypothetical protein
LQRLQLMLDLFALGLEPGREAQLATEGNDVLVDREARPSVASSRSNPSGSRK